jgi:hypothetical protein
MPLTEKLRELPEFNFTPPKGATWEQVAEYIVLLYDKKSELIRQYPDFRMRKERCVALAGFRKGKDGKYPEEIEAIFLGGNSEINKAIMAFVIQQHDPDWILYVTYSTLLASEVEASLGEGDPKKRETIRKNIFELVANIRSAEENIFGGRETEEMRRALYATMEGQRQSIRPEDMARDIQDGKVSL